MVISSTPEDYEGATPKIGGILALRSENLTNKFSYDIFCEQLRIYIMNEFKGGENVVEVTKDHSIDIISDFVSNNKPEELTDEEKNLLLMSKLKRSKSKNSSKTSS